MVERCGDDHGGRWEQDLIDADLLQFFYRVDSKPPSARVTEIEITAPADGPLPTRRRPTPIAVVGLVLVDVLSDDWQADNQRRNHYLPQIQMER
jgi:hypothetical protein